MARNGVQAAAKVKRLEGKVAVVTGAAGGTGAVTGRLFAEEGADVLLADFVVDAGLTAVRRQAGVPSA